ncbi:MAG: GNAT family N-acetyltransferase [Bacillota bacterium]
MKDNFRIRDAAFADLQAIVSIYNSTIPSRMVTADTEPVSVESKEKWFYEHTPDFRPLWVLEHHDKICGWLSFQSFYGRPAYNATAEMSIYIDQAYRGQRLGYFLMQHAIDTCPRLGIKVLLGFVFGHNKPSLALCHKFGFCDWGRLPGVAVLDGVERDLIIVGKRLYE